MLELSNSLVFRSTGLFSDQLQIVMQRLSFHVHKQYYFYNFFFKTTRPIATIFGLKHLTGRGNLNWEIINFTVLTARGGGGSEYAKNTLYFKTFFTMISEL